MNRILVVAALIMVLTGCTPIVHQPNQERLMAAKEDFWNCVHRQIALLDDGISSAETIADRAQAMCPGQARVFALTISTELPARTHKMIAESVSAQARADVIRIRQICEQNGKNRPLCPQYSQ